MANLASVLKEEVSRIVQQEVRRQTAGAAKAAAQGQREVAALKTQLESFRISSHPCAARRRPSRR